MKIIAIGRKIHLITILLHVIFAEQRTNSYTHSESLFYIFPTILCASFASFWNGIAKAKAIGRASFRDIGAMSDSPFGRAETSPRLELVARPMHSLQVVLINQMSHCPASVGFQLRGFDLREFIYVFFRGSHLALSSNFLTFRSF